MAASGVAMSINGSAINASSINGLQSPIVTPGPAPVVDKVISFLSFTATLTGTPDIVVPISVINGEITASGTSSILIVVPNGAKYYSLIASRVAGSIIVSTTENYTDGTSAKILSDNYVLNSVSSARGSRSWSVSLRGSLTLPVKTVQNYTAKGVSVITTNINGSRSVRADYDSKLRSNDLFNVDGSDMVVGRISYVINVIGSYMVVSEL